MAWPTGFGFNWHFQGGHRHRSKVEVCGTRRPTRLDRTLLRSLMPGIAGRHDWTDTGCTFGTAPGWKPKVLKGDHEFKGSGLLFLVEFGGEVTLETSARPHRAPGVGQEDRPLDGVVPLAAQAKGRDPGSGLHPRVGPPVEELQGEGEPGFGHSSTGWPTPGTLPGFGSSSTGGPIPSG